MYVLFNISETLQSQERDSIIQILESTYYQSLIEEKISYSDRSFALKNVF